MKIYVLYILILSFIIKTKTQYYHNNYKQQSNNNNNNQLELIISSNGKNTTIPKILPYSCWHPVLQIYYNSFTLYLNNIILTQKTNITYINLTFQYINQTYLIYLLTNKTQILNQNQLSNIQSNTNKYYYFKPQQQNIQSQQSIISFQNSISFKVDADLYPFQQQITQTIHITIVNNVSLLKISQLQSQQIIRQLYILKYQSTNSHYKIDLPLQSIVLTQFLALVMTILFPYNIQYRTIIPVSFNIIFALFYAFLLFIGVYLSSILSYFTDFNIEIFQDILVQLFSLICMFLYTQDLLSIFLLSFVKLTSVIAAVLSLLVIIADMTILKDAWFINDIIAIGVAGSLIKFVIIKKLKKSLLPILLLWIFFICRQFAIDFHLQTFQQSLQLQLIPLFLQIPAINQDKGFSCSAFGTSKVICFGLLLHYAIRLDLFFSLRFYESLAIVLITLFMGIQLGANIFLDELPTMSFLGIILFIPIYLVIVLLMASKRGQWSQVWDGSFYDIAVNRVKIKRQSQPSTILSIQQSFGQSLKINNTMLSN